ncbi:MAG TPA: AI-2E family transporter [Longimicrobiales bacterium]|nr:AI-2E family transporter [Longimicrobiales bacterium]
MLKPIEEVPVWRVLHIGVVLLVVAGLLYTLLPALSPLILFVALLILAAPLRGTPYYRVAVLTFALLVSFWLLRLLGSLLAPFALALVVAYILDPLVDWIEARGLSRPLAVAVLAVPLLSVVVLAAIFGVPALLNQAEEVIDRVPAAVERAIAWVESMRLRLQRIPLFRGAGVSRALESFSPERLATFLEQRQAEIIQRVWSGVLGVGKGVSTLLSILGYVVLVPVLIVYLLLDFDAIVRRATTLVPVPQRTRWLPLIKEYDTLLGRYFRGQVVEALLVGVLTWIGLLIVGFPYSGFIGAVAGVFNLVPYLGLAVSVIPAFIIAALSGNFLVSLLKVGIVFAIVQLLDSTVTGPRIVGGSVGLHPVWVIFALAAGGFFFGFAGLLLAMPAGVLIKLLLREGIRSYKATILYQGGASEPE